MTGRELARPSAAHSGGDQAIVAVVVWNPAVDAWPDPDVRRKTLPPRVVPFRKTKLVCTIGPATWDREKLFKLADAGINVARLNMSHGDHASHKKVLARVRGVVAVRPGYTVS